MMDGLGSAREYVPSPLLVGGGYISGTLELLNGDSATVKTDTV